jgi:hypothetical protein
MVTIQREGDTSIPFQPLGDNDIVATIVIISVSVVYPPLVVSITDVFIYSYSVKLLSCRRGVLYNSHA